jgi:hypothetical protein
MNGIFNNIGSADEKNITATVFLLQEAVIQGLPNPVQANLQYLLVWFQSLLLPPTQSERQSSCSNPSRS